MNDQTNKITEYNILISHRLKDELKTARFKEILVDSTGKIFSHPLTKYDTDKIELFGQIDISKRRIRLCEYFNGINPNTPLVITVGDLEIPQNVTLDNVSGRYVGKLENIISAKDSLDKIKSNINQIELKPRNNCYLHIEEQLPEIRVTLYIK